jgi:hypothetical protein
MSKVYTECTRCIAWLGEVKDGIPPADAESTIDLIQYMATITRSDDPDSIAVPQELCSKFNAAVAALGTIEHDQNPWWRRIWTVQEAALPEEVILQWGPFELPWSTVEEARTTWVTYIPPQLWSLLEGVPFEDAEVLYSFMAHVAWLGSLRPLAHQPWNMIQVYRLREATDPRDGIYGLMGLVEKGCLPITEKCDYSASAAGVFNTLTKELIVDDAGLRPLICSPRQQPPQATPDVASWAMDLKSSTPHFSPNVYYLMHVYGTYNANDGLDQLDVNAIQEQIGAETLSLTGIHVDTVAHTREGLRSNVRGDQTISWTEALLPVWYKAAAGCEFDVTQEHNERISKDCYAGGSYSVIEAFARLVLGDTVRNGELQPSRGVNEDDIQDVWRLMKGQQEEVDINTRWTVHHMMRGQALMVTETGLFGSGHLDTQIGDQVWIFRGGKVPFVIRPREGGEKNGYTFVGQCYVQGIMQGEATTREGVVEKTVCLY